MPSKNKDFQSRWWFKTVSPLLIQRFPSSVLVVGDLLPLRRSRTQAIWKCKVFPPNRRLTARKQRRSPLVSSASTKRGLWRIGILHLLTGLGISPSHKMIVVRSSKDRNDGSTAWTRYVANRRTNRIASCHHTESVRRIIDHDLMGMRSRNLVLLPNSTPKIVSYARIPWRESGWRIRGDH